MPTPGTARNMFGSGSYYCITLESARTDTLQFKFDFGDACDGTLVACAWVQGSNPVPTFPANKLKCWVYKRFEKHGAFQITVKPVRNYTRSSIFKFGAHFYFVK